MRVGRLWYEDHCPPSGPPAQGSGHSAVELVEKHLRSAAHLKHTSPRCTGSRPATLTASAVKSCTCARTAASPARSPTPSRGTALSTALPRLCTRRPTHEMEINKRHSQNTAFITQGRERVTRSNDGRNAGPCTHSKGAWHPGRKDTWLGRLSTHSGVQHTTSIQRSLTPKEQTIEGFPHC